jgi:anti-anti-sigma factor
MSPWTTFSTQDPELFLRGNGPGAHVTLFEVPLPTPSPNLRITVDVEPPRLTVLLSGEIDLACADLLEAVTQVEVAEVTTVTIDLSELAFSDLSGLRSLLSFRARHLGEHREVRLVHAQPIVRRLFELAGAADCLSAA